MPDQKNELGPESYPPNDPQGSSPIQEQPTASKKMVVPTQGGSRNPFALPVDQAGNREWSHGLFDCFAEPATSVFACLFPCGLFSQTKSRVEALESTQHPSPTGGDVLGADCCLYCITLYCGVPCIFTFMQRQDLQRHYNIKGDAVPDFLVSWCCHCCVLVQHSREVEAEEASFAPSVVV